MSVNNVSIWTAYFLCMTEQNEIIPPVFKNKLSTFNKHSATIADIFGRRNDNSSVMDTIKQNLVKIVSSTITL